MQHLALLVVPSSTPYRATLETQLGAEAYHLDFAADLHAAFARTSITTPDLILLDASMEEPRWHDERARLRADERTARLPVLVLLRTEQITPQMQLDAPDDMVIAPWSAAELRTRILRAAASARSGKMPSASDRHYIAEVVHELRTPLSVLVLMSDNLLALYDQLDDAKRHQIVRLLRERARQLNGLVEDLLVLARTDDPRHGAPRQTINLAALLREELGKQDDLINRKQLHIRQHIEPGLAVHGNMIQIRQVITNLLNNAIKYTGLFGAIEVECMVYDGAASQAAPWPVVDLPVGRWAALRITDSGVGINPDDLQHIFERFYRANSEGDIIGTGLGLAIVREIVQAHGGHIAVTSTPAVGTTFALYLSLFDPH